MELLLNLAWLLLALPAYWLWHSSRSRAERRFTSLQCLLALACVLVVLFPVVSATDDLHVMRAEMEESPASKRSFHHTTSDKASPWNGRLQAPPAILGPLFSVALGAEFLELPVNPSSALSAAPVLHTGRAPPASRLA
jgi:hypothetical protein